jgi:hypothetical protein
MTDASAVGLSDEKRSGLTRGRRYGKIPRTRSSLRSAGRVAFLRPLWAELGGVAECRRGSGTRWRVTRARSFAARASASTTR